MSNYITTIGIEIHIELNTKTKMFSPAKNNFNAKPNTNVHPVDIAYPGTLPVVNKQAVIFAVQLGKALKMDIDETLYFDRKHYFYMDLPKGYQITQNERPIGSEGTLNVLNNDIAIERIHLEEDTAKSIHRNGKTYLNYNRAGVPLIEVVTHPVMSTHEQAVEYVKGIRNLVRILGISNAKMEEGSLRADINISVRKNEKDPLGTKVEIKNLNSLSNIKKAIIIENKKQIKAIENNEEILQATKRFDENKQDTIIMRVKTGAVDYKHFAEPDIPPIYIGKEFIKSIKHGKLPWDLRNELQEEKLNEVQIDRLIAEPSLLKFFNEIKFSDRNKVANILFSEILSLSNKEGKTIEELGIESNEVDILLEKIKSGEISGKQAKTIVPLMVYQKSVIEIIDENNLKQISDPVILKEMISNIIKINKDFIEKNNERQDKVSKFLLGQVMKESKGQANPGAANKLVKEMLN
ncbi:MAG: Asp-tRNA(Asn)/Glu-tRNA(Gln) amidotransferase subunit GatB [Mycoplasmataceae bacterium]|nr:Asp-tRNA(Asn)/Glu-tRNA(Gln) amidotransferase subunit GatB [Mycoplasmataceae bacterium]